MVSRISQRGLRQPKRGFAHLLFGKNLDKNCMKMKEIGPKAEGRRDVPSVRLGSTAVVGEYFTLPVADLHGHFSGTLVWTNISFIFGNFSVAGLHIKSLGAPSLPPSPPISFIFMQFLAKA